MQAGLSTKNAPSPWVVLPHYAYGAIAFLASAILLFLSADELALFSLSPKILGLTHSLILGWITMIIFGALYQLIPVVMEVKLKSELLAYISFAFLGIGTPMMAYSFWTSFIGPTIIMQIGSTLVLISVILFAINTILSAASSKVKTIENRFIITSVIWLLLTVIIGILIIIKPAFLANNFLSIHIHLGIIGWFMMLVIGVASILLPMFFIAHNLNKILLYRAFYFINGGLILLLISLFTKLNTLLIMTSTLSIVFGFTQFIIYNYSAYKLRLRKKLDIGMKHTVMAFSLLLITIIAAILSSASEYLPTSITTKSNIIYGIALIPGFLTALILGQMYKTLPFIVWLKHYQDKVGKYKTPLPADMHSAKAADYHYYSYLVAIILMVLSVILGSKFIMKLGAIALIITALLYLYNTVKILVHKQKLEPIQFNKSIITKQ